MIKDEGIYLCTKEISAKNLIQKFSYTGIMSEMEDHGWELPTLEQLKELLDNGFETEFTMVFFNSGKLIKTTSELLVTLVKVAVIKNGKVTGTTTVNINQMLNVIVMREKYVPLENDEDYDAAQIQLYQEGVKDKRDIYPAIKTQVIEHLIPSIKRKYDISVTLNASYDMETKTLTFWLEKIPYEKDYLNSPITHAPNEIITRKYSIDGDYVFSVDGDRTHTEIDLMLTDVVNNMLRYTYNTIF